MSMRATITHGDTLTLMARVTNDDGSYPAPADITSVTLSIVNTVTAQTVTVSALATSLTAAPTLDDTWREDDTGYNFKHTLDVDPLTFPTPSRYRLTVTLTTPETTTDLPWIIQCL